MTDPKLLPVTDALLTALRASQIAGDERLVPVLAAAGTTSPAEIATRLVSEGILSRWQADYLLSGQPSLRIGNYLLTGRTGQDALGERFTAIQESLGRTVELQVLPESMTAGSENVERFLVTARRLTRFDHPAVLHLYDIAEHKDRLFIVSEHGAVAGAAELPGADDKAQVGLRAVQALLDAVSQIHAQGFSHGSLDGQSVRLSPAGQVKIDRLAANVLQRELVSRSLLETDEGRRGADWKAVAKIATNWLRESSTGLTLPDAHRQALVKALADLASSSDPAKRAKAIGDRIGDLLARLDRAFESRPQESAGPATPPEPRSESRTGRPAAAPSIEKAPEPKRPAAAPKSPRAAPARLEAKSRQRWAVATAISLLSIAALAVGWFVFLRGAPGSSHQNRKGDLERVANRRETSTRSIGSTRSIRSDAAPSTGPAGETAPGAAASSIPPDNTAEIRREPGSVDLSISDDQVASPVDSGQPEAATVDPTSNPLATVTEALATSPDTADSAPSAATGLAPTQDPLPSPGGDNPDPFTIPGGTAAVATDPGTASVPLSTSGSESLAAEKPVMELPIAINLRDASVRDSQQLCPLPPAFASDALELSLESDPGTMGKGKNHFKTRRRGEGWSVLWSRKQDEGEQVAVGQFSMDGEKNLTYVWDTAIDGEHAANCLVNATLVMRAGARVHRAVLREPVQFAAPAIDAETLASEVRVELPWLPKSDALTVEIGELYAETGWGTGIMVDNETFADKKPAGIFLKATPPERLVWLALDADVKARTEFNLRVQTQAGGKLTSMKARDFGDLIGSLQANQVSWQANVVQAELNYRNAAFGTKGDMEDAFKQANKDLVAATALTQLGYEHDAWIKGLVGKPLPVRVIYSTGERSIELARSTGWELPPPASDGDESSQ